MLLTAQEISDFLGGEIIGNSEIKVHSPSKIEEGKEGTISFLANPKYESYAYSTESSILLVSKGFVPQSPLSSTLIKVDDVYASIGKLLSKFGEQLNTNYRISDQAIIDKNTDISEQVRIDEFVVIRQHTSIGKGTVIFPQVYIGEAVVIGENCILYPGVKIYNNTVVGNHCIIHAGAVLGADGFGYSKNKKGE
jgi:UDP-3-O-[3-hydroxymyristoyl] glucosamine N-acyltransferase